jgi:preprotein translocase subunit SecG
MTTVLLLVQMFVTLAMIAVVLIQRSEGGGLGIGSSQGMGSFMGGRGTANLLTRTTAILGATFFGLSLVLALMNKGTTVHRSVLDEAPPPAQTAPARPIPGAATSGPAAAPAPAASVPATPTPSAPAPIAPAPAASAPAAPAPRAPSVPTN